MKCPQCENEGQMLKSWLMPPHWRAWYCEPCDRVYGYSVLDFAGAPVYEIHSPSDG